MIEQRTKVSLSQGGGNGCGGLFEEGTPEHAGLLAVIRENLERNGRDVSKRTGAM